MTAPRDIRLYLDDILESIDRIERHSSHTTKKEFKNDLTIQDAIVHRIEIIGEAVKHIPHDVRLKYPSVPWKEIAGTRDKITHQYFEVDMEQVWKILKKELKPLKKHIADMLQVLENQDI